MDRTTEIEQGSNLNTNALSSFFRIFMRENDILQKFLYILC